MNARSQTFEFAVEGRQIDEVVSCMFHTILFHRCVGKVCSNKIFFFLFQFIIFSIIQKVKIVIQLEL
jgi:phosphatidylglycerophosphatase A